jgi:hypothetical protein
VTTDHVRGHYRAEPVLTQVRTADGDEEAQAAATLAALARKGGESLWPASQAQRDYLAVLQGQRILPADYHVKTEDEIARMDKDEASSLISLLKTFPFKEKTKTQRQWGMPAGRYALIVGDEVWFFLVNKPEDGRWKGYTFIQRLIGAPGNYAKVALPVSDRNRFLARIEADPKAASVLFGKEAVTCGICGSPLTVRESRMRGIGPKCARDAGWL